MALGVFKIFSIFSTFWMTEVTHPLFPLLLTFLRNIPKPESRHLHLSSSHRTLQDIWHDLFLFSKSNLWEKITMDLEMVKNNT